MVSTSLNNVCSFDNFSSPAFKSNQTAKPQSALPFEVLNALDTIQDLTLKIEICGSWVWIFGADGSHESQLRAAGFNWSYKRGCWYWLPQTKKTKAKDKDKDNKQQTDYQPWDMGKIRQKYGSQIVKV